MNKTTFILIGYCKRFVVYPAVLILPFFISLLWLTRFSYRWLIVVDALFQHYTAFAETPENTFASLTTKKREEIVMHVVLGLCWFVLIFLIWRITR